MESAQYIWTEQPEFHVPHTSAKDDANQEVQSYFSPTARTNKTHTMVSFVVLYKDRLTCRSLDIASEDMNSPFWKWHTKHITWYWLWPRSSSPSTRAFSICTSCNTNGIQNNVTAHSSFTLHSAQ
jgi:hypothetical protein